MWLQKFLVYGCLGLLIEVLFTSFSSLFSRHWKLTGNTYLWMLWPYGLTALLLEAVSSAVQWPFWAKAFIYVPIFYGAEALSGVTIATATKFLQWAFGGHQGGVVPWDYQKSLWSPMGLINLRYVPFWFLLALAFDPISGFLTKVLRAAGQAVVS